MSAELQHDHHLGHQHGNEPCPMLMVFHGGHCEQLFWQSWIASDLTEFVVAAIALFVLAFMYEALKFISYQHMKRNSKKGSEDNKSPTAIKPSCSEAPLTGPKRNGYWHERTTKIHIIQTLLYAVQVTISYVLMLVFMNFNYWLCLAVITGLALGFFGFGWMRRINFLTECCS